MEFLQGLYKFYYYLQNILEFFPSISHKIHPLLELLNYIYTILSQTFRPIYIFYNNIY
nr:MAG TPA: hypothetical protein [Caudoviricetes sp.]